MRLRDLFVGKAYLKMLNIRHYFAFGSNMNPTRVRERGLDISDWRGVSLSGFSLSFNKAAKDHPGFGHANIEVSRGQHVEGVLYTLASQAEIIKMDPFERAPWNYGREVIWIPQQQGIDGCWAWTYFANPAVKLPGLEPRADYLDHLLAGKPWLSDGYYQKLLTWRK